MKKTALTLAFILTLCSFTACGNTSGSEAEKASTPASSAAESSEEATETTEAEETTETETTTEAEAEDTTTTAAADDEADADADAEEEKTPAAENTNFKRGKVDGDVYTSEFAGLKFTAPEGWVFAKDEYILSMMNIGLDVTGNDINKALLDQVAIYDAMCTEQSTGQSIIVEFENLAKEVPDPDKFTVEDYFDAVDKQLSNLSGISFTKTGDVEDVTLAGQDFKRVTYKAEVNGITMEQVYYVKRVENFMLGIIASNGTSDTDMTTFEKNFEALS